jgi:hypothetical protein
MQHFVRCAQGVSLMTQHFVVAELCRRKAERLIHLIMYPYICITSCDSSSHSNLAGFSGDCACALPCGEASFKLDELVRGPGVDHGLRLKSMHWAFTLSSLAWAE